MSREQPADLQYQVFRPLSSFSRQDFYNSLRRTSAASTTMLSAPAKSAKRLTSLLSLKNNNNGQSNEGGSSHERAQSADDTNPRPPRPQNQPQPTLRHAASAQHLTTDRNARQSVAGRNVSAPVSADNVGPDDYLVPPPPLPAVNPDLTDSRGSHRRHGSAGANNTSSRASSRGRPESSGFSLPVGSRPGTPDGSRLSKGLSWMPGVSRANRSTDASPARSPSLRAWIAGSRLDLPYDLKALSAGGRVEELWDEQGDTFVYLFPKEAGKPASFKVDSAIFASSPSLSFLAHGTDPTAQSRVSSWPARSSSRQHQSSGSGSSPPPVPPKVAEDDDGGFDDYNGRTSREAFLDEEHQELHLYLPLPFEGDVTADLPSLRENDVDMMILFRNLFAFLLGQSLVGTPQFPTIFDIFMEIAGILKRFEFSNLDGSTYGEAADSSFGMYCEELNLMDVRKSREKTVEAIVLGEQMRYLPLYYEGFTHGVGKLDDLKGLKSAKYDVISSVTLQRLERNYLELNTRLRNLRGRLEEFEFPSLFAGFANSNMANEGKIVRFKDWKNSYMAIRKFVLSYYRSRFGSWPPKARSKKNSFEESGLNRLVLKELYNDLADLYDMLVDRTSLTTRSADMTTTNLQAEDNNTYESIARALRQVMSEYDRSTPPVQPPIPFDIPLMPNIQSIRRKQLDPKKLKKESEKRASSGEVNELLVNSYNHTSMKPTPFLQEFMNFERRVGRGKSCDELIDNRCGQWLFMYSVLNALPMVVVDAADIKYSEGVEYFICTPPRGTSPWCREDTKSGRSWFGVAGGQGVVSLPSELVTHGVEGTYRRSHCWQVAAQWANDQDIMASAMDHLSMDPGQGPAQSPEQQQYQPTPPDRSSSGMMPPAAPLSSTGSSSERHVSGNLTPPTLSLPPAHSGLGRAGNRASINIGLEALPVPAGVMPTDGPSRPVSHNPNLSFDQILGEQPKKDKR